MLSTVDTSQTPRDTHYDDAEDFAPHVLVNRTGALAYNAARFVLDCVDLFARARRDEAEGNVWVVPAELRNGEEGEPYVTADGTPTPRPVSTGQNAWKTARKRGEIRPAAYVWVTEGVDTDAVEALAHRALVLQRLAARRVREARLTGEDVTRDLQIIEGEIRFVVAEIMAQDPSLRDVVRTSYPAYISDRVERMGTDGAGWHWGDGSRYASSLEAHAVHKG